MSKIVNLDFGKERREFARTLGKLLGVVEAQEAAIIADPVKYFGLACKKIHELQHGIYRAAIALNPTVEYMLDTEPKIMRTVTVYEDEYRRMKLACDMLRQLQRRIDSPAATVDGG